MDRPSTKDDAQRRADQIAAFRDELAALAREGVAPFDGATSAAVAAHQERILSALAREFDVDRGAAERQMSIGMRLASLLGAAALTAAVVSFVYRVWGTLPQPGQVALLTAGPLAAVVLMIAAGRVEKTRYVASLLATVACGALVLQTVMLGRLLNLRDSPHILGCWAIFALAIALPWRFGIPFAFGLLALVAYPPALAFHLAGVPWHAVIERPEAVALVAAAALPAVPRLPRELMPAARATLSLIVLLPVLVLSASGNFSLLPLTTGAVRVAYQLLAVPLGVAAIVIGIRRGWRDVVLLGSLFLGAFLLTRFVDWWWDWMPKYLFFLLIAALALGWLWALRIARRRLGTVTP